MTWLHLKGERTESKSGPGSYAVKISGEIAILVLSLWASAGIHHALLHAMGDGGLMVRELLHALFAGLSMVWVVLGLKSIISTSVCKDLRETVKYPWTYKQVYAAGVVRTLSDRWLIIFAPVLVSSAMACGLLKSITTGIICGLSMIAFAVLMVSWIQALRSWIDISLSWWISKYGLVILTSLAFLMVNLMLALLLLNDGYMQGMITQLGKLRLSSYLKFTPPGMLADIFYFLSRGRIFDSIVCFLGLMGYLSLGYLVSRRSTMSLMFHEPSVSRGSQGLPGNIYFKICGIADRFLPRKYIPFFTHELLYLCRWNQFRVMAVFQVVIAWCMSVVILSARFEYYWAFLVFYFGGMSGFMHSLFNKESKGVVHHFLLPIHLRDVLISKNLALVCLQIFNNWMYLPGILFWTWQGKETDLTLAFALIPLTVCVPIYVAATGNFSSVLFPKKLKSFGSMTQRTWSTQSVCLILIAWLPAVIFIGINVYVFHIVLRSPQLTIISFFLVFLVSLGTYFPAIRKSSALMKSRQEKLLGVLFK